MPNVAFEFTLQSSFEELTLVVVLKKSYSKMQYNVINACIIGIWMWQLGINKYLSKGKRSYFSISQMFFCAKGTRWF